MVYLNTPMLLLLLPHNNGAVVSQCGSTRLGGGHWNKQDSRDALTRGSPVNRINYSKCTFRTTAVFKVGSSGCRVLTSGTALGWMTCVDHVLLAREISHIAVLVAI